MRASGGKIRDSVAGSLANARWVAVLVTVLVGLWLPLALGGGLEQMAEWFVLLGLTRDGVFGGAFWQPLSYGLIHGSAVHLGLNIMVLLLVGGRIEHILGGPVALRIFLLGVFGGGVCHILLVPGGPEHAILVGASGGAMAWMLTLTTLSPESRMWPLPVSARNLGLGLLLGSALLAVIDPVLGVPGLGWVGGWVEGRFGPLSAVGHACHLGGGIAGWLSGRWILRPRVSLQALRRRREARERRVTGMAGPDQGLH